MFEEIKNQLAKLEGATTDIHNAIAEAFDGSGIRLQTDIPIVPSERSLADIVSSLPIVGETISKGSTVTTKPQLISEQRLAEFSAQLADVIGRLEAVSSQLRTAPKNGGISSYDPTTFAIITTNGTTINLLPQLRALNNSFDALLGIFQPLSLTLQRRGAISFQSAASSLSAVVTRFADQAGAADQEIVRLKELTKGATEDRTKIGRQLADIQAKREELQGTLTEGTANANEIAQIVATAKQTQAEMEATTTLVRKVKVAADQFKVDFDEFEAALERRNTKFEGGETELALLLERLAQAETELNDIKQRSLDMLSGATVAGLAGVYSAQQADLNGKLKFASAGFYFSVFLLFLSATPLIAYVASPFLVLFRPDLADMIQQIRGAPVTSDWQYAGQVFSRLVILVPAAWLMRVTSGRYNSIFRLREHYAHKYTIAASVEGFKRQAPGYEGDIAAATYAELLYNPTIDSEPVKHEVKVPNRALDIIIERLKKSDKKEPA